MKALNTERTKPAALLLPGELFHNKKGTVKAYMTDLQIQALSPKESLGGGISPFSRGSAYSKIPSSLPSIGKGVTSTAGSFPNPDKDEPLSPSEAQPRNALRALHDSNSGSFVEYENYTEHQHEKRARQQYKTDYVRDLIYTQ